MKRSTQQAEEEEDEEPHVSTSSFPTLLGIGRERGRLSSSTSKDSGDVSAVRRPPADRDEDEDDRLVVRQKRQIQHQDYGDGRTTAAAASDEDEETRDRRFEPGEGHPGL